MALDLETLDCRDTAMGQHHVAGLYLAFSRALGRKLCVLARTGGHAQLDWEYVGEHQGRARFRPHLRLNDANGLLDKMDIDVLQLPLGDCTPGKVIHEPPRPMRTEQHPSEVVFGLRDTRKPQCCAGHPLARFAYGESFESLGKRWREVLCSHCGRVWDVDEE